jgi:hypothetical protein
VHRVSLHVKFGLIAYSIRKDARGILERLSHDSRVLSSGDRGDGSAAVSDTAGDSFAELDTSSS